MGVGPGHLFRVVARGKNRFSMANYKKGEPTVGYRDLQLTVRCAGYTHSCLPDFNAATFPLQNLDLDMDKCQAHCAEVQIHLRDLITYKAETSHEDYKDYRTIMGE